MMAKSWRMARQRISSTASQPEKCIWVKILVCNLMKNFYYRDELLSMVAILHRSLGLN
jgi:hypothetical protein